MTARYRALLVGNSDFPEDPGNLESLHGPGNDLKALKEVLADPSVGLFAPDDIVVLAEQDQRTLSQELEDFLVGAGRDEVLFLYYSGHGIRGTTGGLYLCAGDTKTSHLRATTITSAYISALRSDSPATLLIVLDCCHSGALKSGSQVDLAQPLTGSGRFVIASCGPRQVVRPAAEADGLSPFTECLVHVLRNGQGGADLSINQLYEQLAERCRANGLPIPQQSVEGARGAVAIARSGDQAVPAPPAGVPRNTLPGRVPHFTGRSEERTSLLEAVRRHDPSDGSPVVVVSGDGGVGKSALVRTVAADLADGYEYGFFVDLYGAGPDAALSAEQALEELLGLAGVLVQSGSGSRQALSARWRDWSSQRRVLLVLDNAQESEEQIRDLLPSSPGCLTFVTSRKALRVGSIHRRLSPLGPDDQDRLLRGIAAAENLADDAAVQRILKRTSGFPVAILAVAGSMTAGGMTTATEMDAELGKGALAGIDGLRALFEVSFARLPPDLRSAFGRLGLLAGPNITPFAVALVMGCDIAGAVRLLRQLTEYSLVERQGPGQFAVHDLRLEFAREKAPGDDEVREELSRALRDGYRAALVRALKATGHVTQALEQEATGSDVTIRESRTWLETERRNLMALILSGEDRHTIRVALDFAQVQRRGGHFTDAQECCGRALAGNQITEAGALHGLGWTALRQHQTAQGCRFLTEALAIYEAIGDPFADIVREDLRTTSSATAQIRGWLGRILTRTREWFGHHG